MCMNAIYLNPTIETKADYGIEYGPSIEYLNIIGYDNLSERIPYTLTPGPDGKYRDYGVIRGITKPAPYREATTKRYQKPISYISKNPVHPSYSKIKTDNKVTIDDIEYQITIRDNSVFLDNDLIARAPGNKTKAAQYTFCQAVIYSLMDEPDNIRDYLRSKIASLSRFNMPVMDGVPA